MKKIKAGVCAVTHTGTVRSYDSDNYVLNGRTTANGQLKKGAAYMHNVYEPFCLAVSDGSGSGEAAENASKITCASVISHARSVFEAGDDFGAPLATCLREANQQICDEISAGGQRIGASLAAVYAMKGKLVFVSVGGCRVYRFSDGLLSRVCADSSAIGLELGVFPDEAPLSPSVCVMDDVKDGDIVLICSDGLTDSVPEVTVSDILEGSENAQEAASRLVKTAIRGGGKDNITVIAAYVRVEQAAGFAPIAQNVVGEKDADYSDEYRSNYGKQADINAAIASGEMKPEPGYDDGRSAMNGKKIAFIAGVAVLAIALAVLVAFGVKTLIGNKNRNEAFTKQDSTASYSVSTIIPKETTSDVESTSEESTTATTAPSTTKEDDSSSTKATERPTTKPTTRPSTKPTTKPEPTKPEEPTDKPEEPTDKPEEPTDKPEEPTDKPEDNPDVDEEVKPD